MLRYRDAERPKVAFPRRAWERVGKNEAELLEQAHSQAGAWERGKHSATPSGLIVWYYLYRGLHPIGVKLSNKKSGKISLTVLATQPQRGAIQQPRAAPWV